MQKKVMPGITSILLTVFLFLYICTVACERKHDTAKKTDTTRKADIAEKAAKPVKPNILLIIGDDFGVDVTSDMYPGLIDNLTEKYGPSGLIIKRSRDRPLQLQDLTNLPGKECFLPTYGLIPSALPHGPLF